MTAMETLEHVRFEITDAIATVTLARPPVNALSMQLCLDIAEAFARVKRRGDEVRAVIFTGEGRCFCAGKDTKVADSEPQQERAAALHAAMDAVYRCEVPVVAAPNGPAIGAGFRLVLYCDVVVASTDAVFAMPEVDVGLIPSTATLLRAFNQQQAREIAFTGARYSASDMQRMGLVCNVVGPEQLSEEARALALTFAAKDPNVLRSAKWSANEVELLLGDHAIAHRVIEQRPPHR
jgi:enoyl-CoA hydratase/carnithine racemase